MKKFLIAILVLLGVTYYTGYETRIFGSKYFHLGIKYDHSLQIAIGLMAVLISYLLHLILSGEVKINFEKYQRGLFVLAIFLVSGTAFTGGFLDNHPRVYNILLFGAKPVTNRVLDGVTNGTTTFTSATANFTAADVGKAIRVHRAGAGGHALVTTIASVSNSTTVILSNAATSSTSADTVIYGIDNTEAIQSAILAGQTQGTVEVLVPIGWYIVAGPLITNIAGSGINPNCQIYWPECAMDSVGGIGRQKYWIRGEVPPTFLPINNNNFITPHTGSVIESIIDGGGNGTTGSPASVFSTKSGDTPNNFINANEITFEDLTIEVPMNNEAGGPLIGGINAYYSAGTHVFNCAIAADGFINHMNNYATNDVAGLILNQEGGEVMNHVRDVFIGGFMYGLITADHATVDKVNIMWCNYGRVFARCFDLQHDNTLDVQWCNHLVFVPKSAICAGMVQVGGTTGPYSYFKIDALDAEIYTSGQWFITTDIVNDSSVLGRGLVYYALAQSGVGLLPYTQKLFVKQNADSIYCYNIGQPQFNLTTSSTGAATFSTVTNTLNIPTPSIPGTPTLNQVLTAGNTGTSLQQIIMQNYSATQHAFKAGSFGIESRGFDNTILGNNAHFDGTHWVYDSTGTAQSLQIQAGTWYHGNAVSGSTGGIITWTFPEVIQLTNNTTFTNISNTVTDYATGLVQSASQSGAQYSAIYSASDHAELTANSVGNLGITLTGSSGNSVFPNANVSYDFGTSSLAWRDLYFSHTISKTTMGSSNSTGTNVTSATASGSDEDFKLTLVTSGAVSGTLADMTFGRTWGATPNCTISIANAATGSAVATTVGGYVGGVATSSSNFEMTGAITTSGTYVFQCHCGQ